MANGVIDNKFVGEDGRLLPELRKFNWGAFFLTWIWGIVHNTYITFLAVAVGCIPIIGLFNIFLCIWFGVKGNEWALQNKEWESVEHFNSVQKKWAIGGTIVCCVVSLLVSVVVLAAFFIPTIIYDIDQVEYKLGYKKAEAVLKQAIAIEEIKNKKVDMSSGEAIAKALADDALNTTEVKGNKLTTTDEMMWTFECSNNTSCIVTVDVNGAKEPNEITKDRENLKDQIRFKVARRQSGGYEVLRPKWYKESLEELQ